MRNRKVPSRVRNILIDAEYKLIRLMAEGRQPIDNLAWTKKLERIGFSFLVDGIPNEPTSAGAIRQPVLFRMPNER